MTFPSYGKVNIKLKVIHFITVPLASSQIPNGMCGPFAFEKKKRKKGSRLTLSCRPLVRAKTNLFLSFKIISEGLNCQLVTITCCSSYSIQVSHRELIVTCIPTTILISPKDTKIPSSKNIEWDPSRPASDVWNVIFMYILQTVIWPPFIIKESWVLSGCNSLNTYFKCLLRRCIMH